MSVGVHSTSGEQLHSFTGRIFPEDHLYAGANALDMLSKRVIQRENTFEAGTTEEPAQVPAEGTPTSPPDLTPSAWQQLAYMILLAQGAGQPMENVAGAVR